MLPKASRVLAARRFLPAKAKDLAAFGRRRRSGVVLYCNSTRMFPRTVGGQDSAPASCASIRGDPQRGRGAAAGGRGHAAVEPGLFVVVVGSDGELSAGPRTALNPSPDDTNPRSQVCVCFVCLFNNSSKKQNPFFFFFLFAVLWGL